MKNERSLPVMGARYFTIDIFAVERRVHSNTLLTGPGLDASKVSGYCVQQPTAPNNQSYLDWETKIANPWLVHSGFEVLSGWYDGERDSFGPLSRCVKAKHKQSQKLYEIFYG